jgi:hypothetical protein
VGFESGFRSGSWVFIRFDGIRSISWILSGVAALVSLPMAFLVPAASSNVVGHGGSSLASSDVASEFLFSPMLSSTGACRFDGCGSSLA